MLQVWNTDSAAGYCLNEPTGQVNALEVVKDLLFAGAEVNYFANSLKFLGSITSFVLSSGLTWAMLFRVFLIIVF